MWLYILLSMMYTVWYACVCVSVCLRDAITSPTWPVTGHRFYSVTHVIIAYTDISRLWVYPPVNYHRYGTKKQHVYLHIFFEHWPGVFLFLGERHMISLFGKHHGSDRSSGSTTPTKWRSGSSGAGTLSQATVPLARWSSPVELENSTAMIWELTGGYYFDSLFGNLMAFVFIT